MAQGPVQGVAETMQQEIDRLRAELGRAQQRIAELEARADIDPLLDVLNRRGFERELARALAYLRRYGGEGALVYLDLDRFKAVNDRHGHGVGDRLLGDVVAALRGQVRQSDAIGRLGGDEFAVLMWNIDAPRAAAKAMDLEAAIAATEVQVEGGVVAVRASAGVAMLAGAVSPAEALAAADRAMYARKKERGGPV